MKNFKFYHVSKEYVDYISRFDDKIPKLNGHDRHEKFFVGIVLQINGVSYFAPISSKTKSLSSNIIIRDKNGNPLGSIGLSHMFPVPLSEVKIKNFAAEDKQYADLLKNELFFCNKKKGLILTRAARLHREAAIFGSLMSSVCCSFSLLETKCKDFMNENNLQNKNYENDYEEDYEME